MLEQCRSVKAWSTVGSRSPWNWGIIPLRGRIYCWLWRLGLLCVIKWSSFWSTKVLQKLDRKNARCIPKYLINFLWGTGIISPVSGEVVLWEKVLRPFRFFLDSELYDFLKTIVSHLEGFILMFHIEWNLFIFSRISSSHRHMTR